MIRPTDTWMMNSNGPDRLDDTRGGAGPPNHTYGWTEWHYPWDDLKNRVNDPATVAEAVSLIYDPTNGTVSWGDIFRFGGQKPAGQVFDVLFATSSR